MQFLRNEVEREGKLKLAYGVRDKKTTHVERQQAPHDDLPTAAGLFAGMTISCCFCGKGHASQDCIKAQSMTEEEKKAKIKEKKACYQCLRPGHPANKCRTPIRCPICTKKHYAVMCPDSGNKPRTNPDQQRRLPEGPPNQQFVSMWNQSSGGVLLGTVLVRLNGRARKGGPTNL